jgi:sulfite reductase subunit B
MNNPYAVDIVRIKNVVDEALDLKTFVLETDMDFLPGQFVMVSELGIGEAAISISSYPDAQITFRRVGNVTNALFRKNAGDKIAIRGPFGKPYPIEEIKGKNIILVSGGCGLAPIRSFIRYYHSNRKEFGSLGLFFGARNPSMVIYKDEIDKWKEFIDLHLTVDQADSSWNGSTGIVTNLLTDYSLPQNAVALFCGPPVMIKSVAEALSKKGLADNNMIVSLERNMKCGVGKCGHCTIAEKYVCLDGPTFKWSEIKWST